MRQMSHHRDRPRRREGNHHEPAQDATADLENRRTQYRGRVPWKSTVEEHRGRAPWKSTVEERRFSAASSARKESGFSPRGRFRSRQLALVELRYQGPTSVALQAPKKWNRVPQGTAPRQRRSDRHDPARKSGASAPRQAHEKNRASAPVDVFPRHDKQTREGPDFSHAASSQGNGNRLARWTETT